MVKLSYSRAKDTFPPELQNKIVGDNFGMYYVSDTYYMFIEPYAEDYHNLFVLIFYQNLSSKLDKLVEFSYGRAEFDLFLTVAITHIALPLSLHSC